MSRIYFHSRDGEAEIRGSERAHFGVLLSNLFIAVTGIDGYGSANWLSIIKQGHYLHRSTPVNLSALATAVRGGSDDLFEVDGRQVSTFVAILNTALAIGNDSLKLAARIHGQCEVHGFVEGHNREWLAAMIESGLDSGIFRRDDRLAGWHGVCTFLRGESESPVVMSYSVCDQFPNAGAAQWGGDADDWYGLPSDARWDMAMAGLRAAHDGALEIKPENFRAYRWGGEDAFTLADAASRNAVEK